MDAALWAKLHGATTHFPIALTIGSAALDFAGLCLGDRPGHQDVRAAGKWMMVLGAVGGIAAVTSGLFLTRGDVVGHGTLRWHHLFVWPSFALLVALATWRLSIGDRATRKMLAVYLGATGIAAATVSAAGYWGGELLLGTP